MSEELETELELEVELEETAEDEPEEVRISSEVWTSHTLTFFGPATRAIMLSGEINEELSNAICSQLYHLSLLDDEAPITMYINTSGGSIIDGLAIYDAMMTVPNPVITVVNGGCFSAGLFIACAGSMRFATPSSLYFYHQPGLSNLSIDSLEDMDSTREFYNWCKTRISKIIRKHTGLSKRKWKKFFGDSPSVYFDARKAVKHGFVDEILEFAEKPELILEEG